MLAFEIIAERRIEEAMAEGKFDRLELSGVRVDLEDYFNLPGELRMAWTILRNASCVPAEVELLKEIEALRGRLVAASESNLARVLERQLREKELALAMMIEGSRRRSR